MKITTLLYVSLLSCASLTPAADKADEKVNPMAVALGATGSQALVCNFFAIAELADLYGAKVYDKAKAGELADTFGKLTESAKESLTDLIDSGKLSKEDIASVQEMVIINDLLGKMAGGIKSFVKEPNDENEAVYDKNRKKAWSALTKFLGLAE